MLKRLSKERIFYIVMSLLVALVIFLFSNIPSPTGENTGLNLATVYHFGIFFMFTFFLFLSLKRKKIENKTILTVLFISLAYAFSDELHQLFVPGRFCSLRDVFIDFAGSVFSVLILKIIYKFNRP